MSRNEVLARRFGPKFERPCANPQMIECADWECQSRGRCKDSFRPMTDADARVIDAAIRASSEFLYDIE